MKSDRPFYTLRLDDENNALIILDQSCLPGETVYRTLSELNQVCEAIRRLQVRGAPAIGLAAAYGFYLAAKKSGATSYASLLNEMAAVKMLLASTRPTAVNLAWALDRMMNCLKNSSDKAREVILHRLKAEADAIREEDEAAGLAISENGLSLLKPGQGIITHCNAGMLATSRYGTALGPVYLGQARGYHFKVFVDETRPLLQGGRLTAWELRQAGIDCTLICDSMCSAVMRKGWVHACLVGCDRIAANGDVANKIGTSTLAIAAHHHGIPFYVLGPVSSIDPACRTGDDIVIEERASSEVTDCWYRQRMAPEGIQVFNPAFDITDHELISAIITDRGVVYPSLGESCNAFW